MADSQPLPLVSVVIPMRNEERFIGACLDSLLRQDYPQDRMEIIIADGMSQDRSREIVAQYAQRRAGILLIDNPGRTPAPGLNVAIRRATGRYILRVDAHAEYALDYIRQCVRYLELTGAENVGGPVLTCVSRNTLMDRCIRAITSDRWVVGGSRFRTSMKPQYSDGAVFGAWPRELFDQIGCFNEALTRNQDNEFNSRILRYGGKIYQTPAIGVRYYNQATLRGLCRQALRNGMWNVLTLVANPATFRIRYFAPFFFDLWLVVWAALSLVHPLALVPLLLCVGAYVLFLIGVSAGIVRREGWALLPMLPLAITAYHVCYGLGTFAGLWRFGICGAEMRARARAGSRIPDPAHPPKLGTRALPAEQAEALEGAGVPATKF